MAKRKKSSFFKNSSKSVRNNAFKYGATLTLYTKYFFIIFGITSFVFIFYNFLPKKNPSSIPIIKGPSTPIKRVFSPAAVSQKAHTPYIYHQIEKRSQAGKKIEVLLKKEIPFVPQKSSEESKKDTHTFGERNFHINNENQEIENSSTSSKKSVDEKIPSPSTTRDRMSASVESALSKNIAPSFSVKIWKTLFSPKGNYKLKFEKFPTFSKAKAHWEKIASSLPHPLPPSAQPFFKKINKKAPAGYIFLPNITSEEKAKLLQNYLKQKGINCVLIQ